MGDRQTVIVHLSDEDRLAGYIPEELWRMSREFDVFFEDRKTGELVQILDLTEGK
ncbi:MAG: hypothetical protein KAR06_03260 [Deltaproteobacteria bacterium]|nr:hypothetical protein [Deltaproteobacteria bacterium]